MRICFTVFKRFSSELKRRGRRTDARGGTRRVGSAAVNWSDIRSVSADGNSENVPAAGRQIKIWFLIGPFDYSETTTTRAVNESYSFVAEYRRLRRQRPFQRPFQRPPVIRYQKQLFVERW